MRLSACQADRAPSTPPPPPSAAPRRCHPRRTGAWWRKRSHLSTPTKTVATVETVVGAAPHSVLPGMQESCTMVSRVMARASKLDGRSPGPPGMPRGSLTADKCSGNILQPEEQTTGGAHGHRAGDLGEPVHQGSQGRHGHLLDQGGHLLDPGGIQQTALTLGLESELT